MAREGGLLGLLFEIQVGDGGGGRRSGSGGCGLLSGRPGKLEEGLLHAACGSEGLGRRPPFPNSSVVCRVPVPFLGVLVLPRRLLVLYPNRCIWSIPLEDLLQALSVSETYANSAGLGQRLFGAGACK
jgi:hypothetical protein